MRRLLWAAALLALIGAVWANATRTPGVHFSGDLAGDLRDSVLAQRPATPIGTDFDSARIRIVSVTDWDKLAFVPGAVASCGPTCSPGNTAQMVRIINLTPGGVKKTLYLNIAPFLEDANSQVFALSVAGKSCLMRGLVQELGSLSRAQWPADCIKKESAITRWKPGLF